MLNTWLLITLSWLGTARPQYISAGDPAADIVQDPQDSALQYPLPYVQYYNLPPTRNDYEPHDENFPEQFYPLENMETDQSRNRRDAEAKEFVPKRTPEDFTDKDETLYFRNNEGSPFLVDLNSAAFEDNSTDLMEAMDKKDFSPWGGKRDSNVEHSWTWKRGSAVREPNMPKRVRFSPWGGKRSGQLIVKPGEAKGTKIIFSSRIPELTRIVSNSLPTGPLNFDGYQVIHTLDKRHPINYLALDERSLREAMPFKTFLATLPNIFKSGHPYSDVNLKKDGKRKVKFSAWGGKRSPPIIGPIWTASPRDLKDSTLNTVLLIRNGEDGKETAI